MNATILSRPDKSLLWPAAGIAIAVVVAVNPYYRIRIPVSLSVVSWFVALAAVLSLTGQPTGTRIAAFMAGIFAAVPCFVNGTPLARAIMMCLASVPFLAASALIRVPPIPDIRLRLGYLLNWCRSSPVTRRPRSFNQTAFLRLVIATGILGIAMASVGYASAAQSMVARWLAGGVMVFAFAEMMTASFPLVSAALGVSVPPLMRSPFMSTSIGEFWTKRWNVFVPEVLGRPYCFAPLARHGVAIGLLATFFLSGVAHLLLAMMALGDWKMALLWCAFFSVQPVLIVAERMFHIRRWPRAAARAWTLTALAITSPLFVEPALRIVAPDGFSPQAVPVATAATLLFLVSISVLIALASLASIPKVAARIDFQNKFPNR